MFALINPTPRYEILPPGACPDGKDCPFLKTEVTFKGNEIPKWITERPVDVVLPKPDLFEPKQPQTLPGDTQDKGGMVFYPGIIRDIVIAANPFNLGKATPADTKLPEVQVGVHHLDAVA